jgi:hypothetical protein
MAACATVVALACSACATAEPQAPAASSGVARSAVSALPEPPDRHWTCAGACRRWRLVLDRLDRHRARAYASRRPGLLLRVYLSGSRVLAGDERMLRAWTTAGAAVSGVRLRVLGVSRLPSRGRSVRLRVVDRLAPATARLADGDRVALPRDRPTERVLVLRRTRDGWRIASSS